MLRLQGATPPGKQHPNAELEQRIHARLASRATSGAAARELEHGAHLHAPRAQGVVADETRSGCGEAVPARKRRAHRADPAEAVARRAVAIANERERRVPAADARADDREHAARGLAAGT